MKRFLINCLIFFGVVIGTLLAGEILVRQSPNPYKTKDRFIHEHGRDIGTLILGNSHSFYGVRADLWPDTAINLGNVSQTIEYDRRLLEHNIDRMPHLKRVLMQVSYTSLYDDKLENTDEWWRCINYQLYMGTDAHSPLSKYSLEASHIPVYIAKLRHVFGIGGALLTCDSIGNGMGYNFDKRDPDWENGGAGIAERHIGCYVESRLPVNLAHLEAIADTCAGRGVELILFTQPDWHTYRDNVDPQQVRRTDSILTRLSAQKGIKYLNYFDDPRFVDRDFFDADHLTHEYGAVKLTDLLIDQVMKK